MTFVSSNLLLILLLLIESAPLSRSVLPRYIAPILDHGNLLSLLTVLILRKSDFCFSAGLPFPRTPPELPNQDVVSKNVFLTFLWSACFKRSAQYYSSWWWWPLFFIQLMCYYLTWFLSSFNIIFLIIFEPRFICWVEFLVESLQH